jgi:hypothetical protein
MKFIEVLASSRRDATMILSKDAMVKSNALYSGGLVYYSLQTTTLL